jgi:enolase
MDTKIRFIEAEEILDSRGNPTISVTIGTKDVVATAAVPSGASRGEYEALELRDNNPKKFNGLGVQKAINNIKKIIAPNLKGKNVLDQKNIDKILIELDATPNKSRLGANATIGVSLAVSRLAGLISKKPLFLYLRELTDIKPSRKSPFLYLNLVNGGKHTLSPLKFQEYMIVPQTDNIEEAINIAFKIQNRLRETIREKYGSLFANFGDEGGIVPNIFDVKEPLRLLIEAGEKSGELKNIKLAMDVAASSFYKENLYDIGDKKITNKELLDLYKEMAKNYPLISIEDPFEENAFDDFKNLKNDLGKKKIYIVGDDLTVTNSKRLKMAIEKSSINAIIIKPNQIGTLTETLETMKLARENNLECIVSHRSGETNDDFIADLAFAFDVFGLKAGALNRGERVAKYNRLLQISKES